MIIIDILYSLIIKPLILVFDLIFSFFLNKILYVGWSIVILSIVVNILVLPLYNKADSMQLEEVEKKKKISKWESHIKKAFKGDEKFMMLQTYYRQNGYKPYQTLKSAMPLLLEIPFFIAAYQYLSHLQLLNGMSFGPITDLSKPDGLLRLFGLNINILPILMTIINFVSGTVYNRLESLKDRVQLYVIAAVFLVLLYNSPSGLVLYWTCNNIFSFLKNVTYIVIEHIKKNNGVKQKIQSKTMKKSKCHFSYFLIFMSASLLLSLLVGAYIPSLLIRSSVEEFISYQSLINPSIYIINSLLVGIGLFFVWIGVFFFLLDNRGKMIISSTLFILCIIAFLNFSSIPFDSSMTMFLTINSRTQATPLLIVRSIIVIISAFVLGVVLVKYKRKAISFVLVFSMVSFVIINFYLILDVYKTADYKIGIIKKYDNMPEVHLSRNGKNVVVIMMDKMVGYYVPFIMNEKPELLSSWDGFTFYPNCISLGTATNGGSPGLYGGYEYSPENINKRNGELLKDKQNEALKVMPVMFLNDGYDVTVGDPTYANYEWIPNPSIYDDYPDIYTYISGGKLNPKDLYYSKDDVLYRNLIMYGIYRSAPIFLQSKIYDGGYYGSATTTYSNGIGLFCSNTYSSGYGISEEFYNEYSFLMGLSDISVIVDEECNTFNMFSNNTTHEANLLQEPDYTLSAIVDNTTYDNEHPIKYTADGQELSLYNRSNEEIKKGVHAESETFYRVMCYHSNMAAMIKLGDWFDYLRSEGVYDNTRIIIVSDHSCPLGLDQDLFFQLEFADGSNVWYDMLMAQSTLLVKDFDGKGFKTDNKFMTNADVPTIATKDLIDNPKNPFTGNAISSEDKDKGPVHIMVTKDWHTDINNGCTFMKTHWFSVHDNIFDETNWDYYGAY